jgi:methanogenic corrinoid protein MtbC1
VVICWRQQLQVIDLGTDVPAEVRGAVRDEGPNSSALSALLTTTLPAMEKAVKAVKEATANVR